jgi:hypothetical protein
MTARCGGSKRLAKNALKHLIYARKVMRIVKAGFERFRVEPGGNVGVGT